MSEVLNSRVPAQTPSGADDAPLPAVNGGMRLPALARKISTKEARAKLTTLYFQSMGAGTVGEVNKLFQWGIKIVKETITGLVDAGILEPAIIIDKEGYFWCEWQINGS